MIFIQDSPPTPPSASARLARQVRSGKGGPIVNPVASSAGTLCGEGSFESAITNEISSLNSVDESSSTPLLTRVSSSTACDDAEPHHALLRLSNTYSHEQLAFSGWLRELANNSALCALAISFGVVVGSFGAVATVVQDILQPRFGGTGFFLVFCRANTLL